MHKLVTLAALLSCGTGLGRASKPSPFANQSKPMAATVRILAVSSSSRQNFAGNQEIYIADVNVKKGSHEFARLIDQYPGYGLPIRGSVLKAGNLLKMQVTREPECDVPVSDIYLPASSGAVFDGSIRTYLAEHRNESIPCYRTIHQTIQLTKK